jgi:amino acid adenylation domain-containing protein
MRDMTESLSPRVVASYPLTPLQEGMFFNQLLAPQASVDVEQLVLSIAGTVDAGRLRAAWQTASERHAVLRTSFRWASDERPIQDVWAAVSVPFAVEELGTLDAPQRAAAGRAAAAAERRLGVALASAPLQRVRLLRFGDAAAAIVWTFHHAVLDGHAALLVLRDVFDAYAGRALASPGVPFRAHVDWLEGHDAGASEPFWRRYLQSVESRTPLPASLQPASPDAPAGEPGVVVRTLDATATSALAALARANRTTLQTLVQAAWSLLLARHAGTSDVVFGAVRACRGSGVKGSSGIVGLLINTVPLRVRVDEDAPLSVWLEHVREQWQALREVEHTPLRTVASWSPMAAHGALFDSLVVYDRAPFYEALRTGVDFSGTLDVRGALPIDHTGFPLTLAAAGITTLELRLQFQTPRFERADAERLIGQVEAILRAFPAAACVRDVAMLSADEARRIVSDFNRTSSYPRDATIHGLFAEVAARAPDAIAVQLGAATMTYRELDARSDAVAAHLRTLGVGRGSYVGVCVERSFEMPAALLGVLKAGAASIGIDPATPPQRLAAMLGEARARIVVAQPHLTGTLAPALAYLAESDIRVVTLDDLEAGTGDGKRFDAGAGAEDAAHVMFTSGSTGTPKGAVIPHRGAVRTVRGADYLDFNPGETFFGFVPLTFDAAILEIWGPLLNGGRLVLCPPGLPSLDVLAATIEDGGVTTLWLTTALFEQMVEEQLPRLRGLRQLIVGGDVMSPPHARRALAGLPQTRLVNIYGPTEATVLITAQPVAAPPDGPIPLGGPIANAAVYVLDALRRPVPVGVPGEIYTGGDGLALGYLNRPDFTAERFVPDPFSARPGATMYRTGDLARWRADGTIDFLGRIDTQVKIAGVRIELGEIECALNEHPEVREAVVVAVAVRSVEKRLVAYVVPRAGETADAAELRAYLGARLPQQMVPAYVVVVESLALTPTGKYDRKSLVDAGLPAVAAAPRGRRAPRTDAEVTVAAHLADVLGLDDVENDDDFYRCGGDSLRAMRLVARLREAFRVEFTVRDLIDAPSVAGMAATLVALERRPARRSPSRVNALRAGGTGTPIFFLHGDLTGGGYYCREIARRIDASHPIYVIDPHGSDGELPPSIEVMARENVRAIRRLYPRGSVLLGGFCNGGVVAFEMARLLERAGVRVEHLTVVDAQLPKTVRAPIEAFARRKGRRALEGLGIVERRSSRAVAGSNWETWHRRSLDCWYDVLARYAPGRYAGSVSLLWTSEHDGEVEQFDAQWRRFASAAVTATLPGGHLTAITRHLAQTSAIVAAHLCGSPCRWDERATREDLLQPSPAGAPCYGTDGTSSQTEQRSLSQA